MSYLIALDIGTTSTKAVAVDAQGATLATCNVPYKLYHTQDDRAEQHPADIWAAVSKSLQKIQRACRKQGNLQGIVFSAAMHSLMAVDEAGLPLTPLLTWADNRAADIAIKLRLEKPELYTRTGTPLHAMSVLPKLIWLREHQPDIFQKARRFCGIKEYVMYQLTGQWICDHSIASATGLMRLDTLEWDEEALQLAGIDPERLPRLVAPQFHLPALNEVPVGTPVIAGASDGCCANLGAEATQPGDMVITIGTSSALRACTQAPYLDPQMRTFCYLLDANRPVIGGGANSGAYVLQWMKENLFAYRGSLNRFYALAATVAPGSDGLLFFPYLMGERAPLWDAQIRGALTGLGVAHTRAHLIRAAMEGVVYNLASIGDVLRKETPLKRLIATGGFTQNPVWLQICADVFQTPVQTVPGLEASARGALALAREALNLPPLPPLEGWVTYLPDEAVGRVYAEMRARFSRDLRHP
jgi:gluconokinase